MALDETEFLYVVNKFPFHWFSLVSTVYLPSCHWLSHLHSDGVVWESRVQRSGTRDPPRRRRCNVPPALSGNIRQGHPRMVSSNTQPEHSENVQSACWWGFVCVCVLSGFRAEMVCEASWIQSEYLVSTITLPFREFAAKGVHGLSLH